MAALPLLKLGGLAVKTLAKPVAKRLKNEAATRPKLKQLYVSVGQWTHRATAWITISAAGHKSLGVKDLEEAAAFARGADFLSEAFVFFVGGAILTFEYTRSNMSAARKEAEKERGRQQFREDLETRFLVLEARLEALEEKNAAGWARLLGRKEGNNKQGELDTPHFADPTQVKQRRRRLSGSATGAGAAAGGGAVGGAAAGNVAAPSSSLAASASPSPAVVGGQGGGAGVGSASFTPVVGSKADGLAPLSSSPSVLTPDAAAAAASAAAPGAVAAVADAAAAPPPSGGGAGGGGLWGRVLGWVGLGGGKGRRPQPQPQPPLLSPPAPAVPEPVAAAGATAPLESVVVADGRGKVKATSPVVVIRRHPPGRRQRGEEGEGRYWWRVLFV